MATLNTYLNFNGNTETAFNFYKSVFGGEFFMVQRFKDTPGSDKMSDTDKEKIMHMSLQIGKTSVLMGTDVLESMGQSLTIGNNYHICIGTTSKEEADKLFNGLSADGNITMPIQDMFWGAYFGMCIDKFGVQWMISYDPNFQEQL